MAVVVGPNGSGKSNVSDGIVWAAGSLAPSELRAEKPDDVLFAGAAGRKATDFCEVELLFDNADGDGPVEFSELSISRRLHRGGEGQYLVNRTGVRRIDLVELLADLGLGGGMHSIIGQGKVEEVLVVVAGAAARDDRGGRGARALQAPAPPRRAEAAARRDPGGARARRRGRGQEAAAAARAAGDRGRARGEARRRDRLAARADRAARPRRARRPAGRGRGAAHGGRARTTSRQRAARGAARRSGTRSRRS